MESHGDNDPFLDYDDECLSTMKKVMRATESVVRLRRPQRMEKQVTRCATRRNVSKRVRKARSMLTS